MDELHPLIAGKLMEIADRKARHEARRRGERRVLDSETAAAYKEERRVCLEWLAGMPIATEEDLRLAATTARPHVSEWRAEVLDTLHVADLDEYRSA